MVEAILTDEDDAVLPAVFYGFIDSLLTPVHILGS